MMEANIFSTGPRFVRVRNKKDFPISSLKSTIIWNDPFESQQEGEGETSSASSLDS